MLENLENEPSYRDIELLQAVAQDIKKEGMLYSTDLVSKDTYAQIFDSLGNLEGKKFIDLGAGLAPLGVGEDPRYTEALSGRGVTLIPVDSNFKKARTWKLITKEIMYENKTEQDRYNINVQSLTADAFTLPFRDNSIDGCISINLFNLRSEDPVESAKKILEQIFKVLKKGGVLIISTFGYFKKTFKDGKATYNNQIQEKEILKAAELRKLAEILGFQISEIPLNIEKTKWTEEDLEIKNGEDKNLDSVEIIEPVGLLLKKI